MSVTSGFYNSLSSRDRLYYSEQISDIFCGVINEGVFESIGTAFEVKADSGNTITIGIGRAWVKEKWIYNDAILPITLDSSEVLLDRYDAVVLETDRSDAVRDGNIVVLKGTPSSEPAYPTMVSTVDKKQMPLAYIYRKAGSASIVQANITNKIGSDSCPYITGILQVQSIEKNVAQWEGQWNQWFSDETAKDNTQMSNWIDTKQQEFNTWFTNLQVILDGDTATKLASEILNLQTKFNTLETEHCIYQELLDSDGNLMLDSTGSTMTGKVVYQTA